MSAYICVCICLFRHRHLTCIQTCDQPKRALLQCVLHMQSEVWGTSCADPNSYGSRFTTQVRSTPAAVFSFSPRRAFVRGAGTCQQPVSKSHHGTLEAESCCMDSSGLRGTPNLNGLHSFFGQRKPNRTSHVAHQCTGFKHRGKESVLESRNADGH